MEEGIHRELQQRLALYSIGFSATKSGIEIRVLKKLFSEDDARMFLALSHRPEETATLGLTAK